MAAAPSIKMKEEIPHGEMKGFAFGKVPIHPAERRGQDDKQKRTEKKRRRESFYVCALLIGPHLNFKQVSKNSDLGRGFH